jgi:hypothetical protein
MSGQRLAQRAEVDAAAVRRIGGGREGGHEQDAHGRPGEVSAYRQKVYNSLFRCHGRFVAKLAGSPREVVISAAVCHNPQLYRELCSLWPPILVLRKWGAR